MHKIQVSIIIPVYNVFKYLNECLESVFKERNILYEVIIVNDGSTDKSMEIIERFMIKYNNITLINQINKGLSAARNVGLARAKGEYIYFLDSDDYIKENSISELYITANQNNLDLLLFDGSTFIDKDYYVKENTKYYSQSKKSGNYPNVMLGHLMFEKLVMNNDYKSSVCLLFIKRDLMIKNGINFYEGIIHEDEIFTFKIILESQRAKYINKTYFYRRIRGGSIMTSKNYMKSYIGCKTVYYLMLSYRDSLSSIDDNLYAAINKKIGEIYGSTINNYCFMSIKEKKYVSHEINELKESCAQNKYFMKTKYFIFHYYIPLYCFLKKAHNLMVIRY